MVYGWYMDGVRMFVNAGAALARVWSATESKRRFDRATTQCRWTRFNRAFGEERRRSAVADSRLIALLPKPTEVSASLNQARLRSGAVLPLQRHARAGLRRVRHPALRFRERIERGQRLEAPRGRAGAGLGLGDRQEQLLRRREELSVGARHVEPDAHPFVVVLEQMAGHGEQVAFLRLLEIMQHHLQRV